MQVSNRASNIQFVAFLGLVSSATLLCYHIGDQFLNDHPQPARAERAKIIPWIEINSPLTEVARWFPVAGSTRPGVTMRDYCLEGLALWSKLPNVDTVIVSTAPDQVRDLYSYLMKHKPKRLRIVGGIKTYRLPGGTPNDPRAYEFADMHGWQLIAAEARYIAKSTGVPAILLENETTLGRFHRGEATIDYGKLHVALSALDQTTIEFWWNLPRVLPNTEAFPDRALQTRRLVTAIAKTLPTSVFLGGDTMWHDQYLPARKLMRRLVGPGLLQDRLLVTPDGYMRYPTHARRCFTPAEALAWIAKQPTDAEINVYPGGAFWVAVPRELLRLTRLKPTEVTQ